MPRWQQQWTDAEVQEIIALKRAGLNYRQIGEQVNRSMWAVRERLRCCDPNYYERKIRLRNERRGSRALSSPDPVEGSDEQPRFWRTAEAANEAFLDLLRQHHPDQEGLVTDPCTERPIPIRNDNHVYISSSMGLV